MGGHHVGGHSSREASSGGQGGTAEVEGLLTVPADENVIRILPPLVIETSHVDEAIEIIGNVAAKWEHGNADA